MVPFVLTFISTFGTLGVKVALLKLMTMATIGDDTIKRLAMGKWDNKVTHQIDQDRRLGCMLFLATVSGGHDLTEPRLPQVPINQNLCI